MLDFYYSHIFNSILAGTTAQKVSKYRVFSGPYFPVFGLNTGKYGPEKTPYLDSFYAVYHISVPRNDQYFQGLKILNSVKHNIEVLIFWFCCILNSCHSNFISYFKLNIIYSISKYKIIHSRRK